MRPSDALTSSTRSDERQTSARGRIASVAPSTRIFSETGRPATQGMTAATRPLLNALRMRVTSLYTNLDEKRQ